MEGYPTLQTRDLDELNSVMALMPRQQGCVVCSQNVQLVCPEVCTNGQVCGFKVLLDCTSCPQAACLSQADNTPTVQSSSPNVGAIAGGVVGGIFAAAFATYLVWRLCVKPKRSQVIPDVIIDPSTTMSVDEKNFASPIDQRASTHTVHSIASTVLTHASNIIQIAYIPGVTNRAHPAILIPPVPPIPSAMRESSSTSKDGESHFFTPRDLRNSKYSDMSSLADRTSYARTSYAPRSSIASTVYGKHATVHAPAQKGVFSRPTVVSVKTKSSGDTITPTVPPIDHSKYGRPTSGHSNFSIGSTFLNNANTATQARAQVVKVKSKSGLRSVRVANANSNSTTADDPALGNELQSSDQDSPSEASSPTDPRGPFADPAPSVPRPVSIGSGI